MDGLIRRRAGQRRLFEKYEKEIEELMKVEPPDMDAIDLACNLFQETKLKVLELDGRIYELLLEDPETTVDVENQEMDETGAYARRAEALRIKVAKLFPRVTGSDTPVVAPPSSTSGESKKRFNLPEVKIKKFSGNLMEWLKWWAQFQKIDEDEDLHPSDKFVHLVQCLEPGSEPFEMISGYPINAENYPVALEALKRRFGSEDLLLQVYIRELLGLVISNVQTKDKMPFKNLQMKLDSYLRALKSLNLERADPATWLFPLVESSLPEDILYSWQRHPLSTHDGRTENPPKTRLDNLMTFMEQEVRIRQRIELSRSFSSKKKETKSDPTGARKPSRSIAAAVVEKRSDRSGTCIFCNRPGHESKDCFRARRIPYNVKREILQKKGLCYNCFEKHMARNCMNRELKCQSEPSPKRPRQDNAPSTNTIGMANVGRSGQVLLQTLIVKLGHGGKQKEVRAFLDSGSQRSYLLDSTAEELNLKSCGVERTVHCLFGGAESNVTLHRKFNIQISGTKGDFSCRATVRSQNRISDRVPRLTSTQSDLWRELEEKGILLSDVGAGSPPIKLLIGADLYGKILTPEIISLRCGVVAVRTKLGWTLTGEVNESVSSMAIDTINMATMDSNVTRFWELEVIGIRDSVQVKEQNQIEEEVKQKIIKTITRGDDGRYTVGLPCKESLPFLPTNRDVALKRLESATRTLLRTGTLELYNELFRQWKDEGIIEMTGAEGNGRRHYVPHRAVVKESSSTTPVRPVFDCSCRVGRAPSLNDCLHKGGSLILRIPEVLLRFREKNIGFVSDIRKAFLMIGIEPEDREFLRFLMWKDKNVEEIIEYRHARLPFGANCSPFILGVILEHHLTSLPEEKKEIGNRLIQSMYVDNCVSSVHTVKEYEYFRSQSTEIMKTAAMDLRLWMSGADRPNDANENIVSVLGLMWNRIEDVLNVDVSRIVKRDKVTKRAVLSAVQKIFDPIGFTSPVTISMKILLHQIWMRKLKPLSPEIATKFLEWCNDTKSLEQLRIPRRFAGGGRNRNNWEVHTFVDVSREPYAAAVFLRDVDGEVVSVQLLAAKSRVAPDKTTIPRLELLSCLIGARLTDTVKLALQLENIPTHYWSDSTTAITWIQREDQWGTFVGNRTEEIRRLSEPGAWSHVPGPLNPADLPSRGCSVSFLLESNWWRGPDWLYLPRDQWPTSELEADEAEVLLERKKGAVVALKNVIDGARNQHSYRKLVRIVAWILRFRRNSRKGVTDKQLSLNLTASEIKHAERALLWSIQHEVYSGDGKSKLKSLEVVEDENGLYRVKTQLTYRKDEYNFKLPVILPGKHRIVQRMIIDTHRELCHAGVGFMVAFYGSGTGSFIPGRV